MAKVRKLIIIEISMTTPLTIRNESITAVSGSTVVLIASQVVHTIRVFPATGGMTLTMPSAASFFDLPNVLILKFSQSDFTVINHSLTEEITLVTPNSFGDLIIAPDHAGIFRMLWTEVVGSVKSFILYRIGGTDSSANLSSSGQLLLSSSQSATDAIRILASATAGGIDVDSGTGGVDLTSTGTINLTSSSTAGTAMKLTTSNTNSSIELDSSGGIALRAAIQGITTPSVTGPIILETTFTGAASINLRAVGGSGSGSIKFESGTGGTQSTTTGIHFVDSERAGADALQIRATDSSGGVQIKAGTGGIRLNTAATSSNLLGAFDASPVIQRTTSTGTVSTFAAGTGTSVLSGSTFDGYTIGQIVGALRDYGLLA